MSINAVRTAITTFLGQAPVGLGERVAIPDQAAEASHIIAQAQAAVAEVAPAAAVQVDAAAQAAVQQVEGLDNEAAVAAQAALAAGVPAALDAAGDPAALDAAGDPAALAAAAAHAQRAQVEARGGRQPRARLAPAIVPAPAGPVAIAAAPVAIDGTPAVVFPPLAPGVGAVPAAALQPGLAVGAVPAAQAAGAAAPPQLAPPYQMRRANVGFLPPPRADRDHAINQLRNYTLTPEIIAQEIENERAFLESYNILPNLPGYNVILTELVTLRLALIIGGVYLTMNSFHFTDRAAGPAVDTLSDYKARLRVLENQTEGLIENGLRQGSARRAAMIVKFRRDVYTEALLAEKLNNLYEKIKYGLHREQPQHYGTYIDGLQAEVYVMLQAAKAAAAADALATAAQGVAQAAAQGVAQAAAQGVAQAAANDIMDALIEGIPAARTASQVAYQASGGDLAAARAAGVADINNAFAAANPLYQSAGTILALVIAASLGNVQSAVDAGTTAFTAASTAGNTFLTRFSTGLSLLPPAVHNNTIKLKLREIEAAACLYAFYLRNPSFYPPGGPEAQAATQAVQQGQPAPGLPYNVIERYINLDYLGNTLLHFTDTDNRVQALRVSMFNIPAIQAAGCNPFLYLLDRTIIDMGRLIGRFANRTRIGTLAIAGSLCEYLNNTIPFGAMYNLDDPYIHQIRIAIEYELFARRPEIVVPPHVDPVPQGLQGVPPPARGASPGLTDRANPEQEALPDPHGTPAGQAAAGAPPHVNDANPPLVAGTFGPAYRDDNEDAAAEEGAQGVRERNQGNLIMFDAANQVDFTGDQTRINVRLAANFLGGAGAGRYSNPPLVNDNTEVFGILKDGRIGIHIKAINLLLGEFSLQHPKYARIVGLNNTFIGAVRACDTQLTRNMQPPVPPAAPPGAGVGPVGPFPPIPPPDAGAADESQGSQDYYGDPGNSQPSVIISPFAQSRKNRKGTERNVAHRAVVAARAPTHSKTKPNKGGGRTHKKHKPKHRKTHRRKPKTHKRKRIQRRKTRR